MLVVLLLLQFDLMTTDYEGSSFVTTNMKLWLQVMVAVLLLLQVLNYRYSLWWQLFCYYNHDIMATDYDGSSVVTTNMKLRLQIMMTVLLSLQI